MTYGSGHLLVFQTMAVWLGLDLGLGLDSSVLGFKLSEAMASSVSTSVTALQVGSYFVGQYYHVLQQQPEFVHQFYTDSSMMFRADGDKLETANGMVEIHNQVMSLNYIGCVIEIKSVDAQDSLNGGVLIMVTGSIQRKEREIKRSFIQTVFLAPQEKGYYVLNDIFRLLEDDQHFREHSDVMTNGDLEPQLKPESPVTELESEAPAPLAAEIKREFITDTPAEEEAVVDEYNLSERKEVSEAEEKFEEATAEASTAVTDAAIPASDSAAPAPPAAPTAAPAPVPAEEASGEAPRHTYASILRVVKGPSAAAAASSQTPLNKTVAERHLAPQSVPQQPQPAPVSAENEETHPDVSDDNAAAEIEGDGRSIYVRNLPSSVTLSEVEQEFKRFGKIKYGGVTVRNRKEIGGCYAFIDFEDTSSAQNALAASPFLFSGRQIFVEEKRTSSSSSRGRRGRGRGFQNEGMRGRGYYGARPFGRASGQDFGRDYNRGRGSGSRGGFAGTGGTNGFQQMDSQRGNAGRQPRRSGVTSDKGSEEIA